MSSISASSAPAMLAWILARMLLSRLLWWILESRQAGPWRLMAEVMRRWAAAGPTGRPAQSTSGFHSGSTSRHGPLWLLVGDMPLVPFSPRVSVSRTCTPSRMPFARSVAKTASRTSSSSGSSSNMSARAESSRRRTCWSSANTRPSYTRSPSHTASPPCTTLSKTETLASLRGTMRPPTKTRMSRLRGSGITGSGRSRSRCSSLYIGKARSDSFSNGGGSLAAEAGDSVSPASRPKPVDL
mmetsp:Transcript_6957/g.21727  ORF Transcript_6957/g.21727 Transcript_6957/m.21727 type:complete len:241 (-) Transcript_6957:675-1397(-)